MKKISFAMLTILLLSSNPSNAITCSELAYQDCQPALFANYGVAVALGQATTSYSMNYQNYGNVVSKIMAGDPIATIVVPSCFALTFDVGGNCGTNVSRWENSGNLSLNGNMSITLSSNPAPANNNIVFTNQADPSYTLQASAQYCSCNESATPGPSACQTALTTFYAGVPTPPIQYNPGSPVLPLNPCGTPNGTPQEYNAGFWVFNLTSPTGQVPPAGNYNTNLVLQASQVP